MVSSMESSLPSNTLGLPKTLANQTLVGLIIAILAFLTLVAAISVNHRLFLLPLFNQLIINSFHSFTAINPHASQGIESHMAPFSQ
jgi:hypothetical protein